jgi:Tfp pilus assembly protein PilN
VDTSTQHLILAAFVAVLGIAQTALHNRNSSDIAQLRRDLAQCRENIHELRQLLYERADITNRNIT